MSSDRYYIRLRQKVRGPYTVDQLRRLVSRGQFTRMYQISTNQDDWQPATDLPEVFGSAKLGADKTASAGPRSNGSEESWYYESNGQRLGPVSKDSLRQLLFSQKLSTSTLVWQKGMSDWNMAATVFPELGSQSRGGQKTVLMAISIAMALFVVLGAGVGISYWRPWQTASTTTTSAQQGVVSNAGGTNSSAHSANQTSPIPTHASLSPTATAAVVPQTGSVGVPAPPPHAPVVNSAPTGVRAGEIHSVDIKNDEVVSVINHSVGMVVFYLEINMHDGAHHELWMSHGSSFVVNPEGYAITNRHVVASFQEWSNATATGRIDKMYTYYEEQYIQVAIKRGWTKEQLVERLKDVAKTCSRIAAITPHCVVYFKNKGRAADLHYVSNRFDMAVLRINELPSPSWFALSASNTVPRTSPVFAFGFPGTSSQAVTDAEKAIMESKTQSSSMEDILFGSRDHRDSAKASAFEVSPTSGEVELVQEETGSIFNARHSARINGGNSGGPLVLRENGQGVVFGINTLAITSGIAPVPIAFPIAQMKSELEEDAKVPNLTWR